MRSIAKPGLGLIPLALFFIATPALGQGLRLFTAHKMAAVRDNPGVQRDGAFFRFHADRELESLVDPRCPNPSRLEIGVLPASGFGIARAPAFELSCARWQAIDGGYLYRDRIAGARVRIRFVRGGLSIRVHGANLTAVRGPAAFLQLRFDIGDERFMGRFYRFRSNAPGSIRTHAPSLAESAGEAAFWDTLWGIRQRDEECLARLEEAVDQDPANGRAYFLMGMMRLYRLGSSFQSPRDWRQPRAEQQAEIALANDAFEQAVPLLWDGVSGDSRVPGFAAAALYQLGVLTGDDATVARALALLEEAVVLNPIFNNFNLFSSLPVVDRNDPLLQRGIEAVNDVFGGPTAGCFFKQPELCANAGLAPHNGEGAMLMFGDIYAKAGLSDDAARAYGVSQLLASNGDWQFDQVPAERMANLEQRVMLYANDDQDDDPPLFGFNGGYSCDACHRR